MTREQFLNGTSFRLAESNYKGAITYKYEGDCIMKELRSIGDDKVLFTNYHSNMDKIGRVGFKGFTYVFDKKVNISLRFEDLIVFEEGV